MKALILAVLFLVGLCIAATGVFQGVVIMAVAMLIGFNLPLSPRDKIILELNALIKLYKSTTKHDAVLFSKIQTLKGAL